MRRRFRRLRDAYARAHTDFYTLAAGGSLVIPALNINSPVGLRDNDTLLSTAANSNGGFLSREGQIQSVNVPAANAGQISAVLGANETVTVTAQGGFRGASFFD